MGELKLGRDYGVTVTMPWWLKILSWIPIVNLFFTHKVCLQILAFTPKGEPFMALRQTTRIPYMPICPIRINFAFPEGVGPYIKVFIRNRSDDVLFCRDLLPELDNHGCLKSCQWIKGVEIEKIDKTER